MKTWWDYWPLMVFIFVVTFIPFSLPTKEFKGKMLGGGIVRQMAVNRVAEVLPPEAGQRYIDKFNTATSVEEFIIVSPVVLNLATILILITFFILSAWIRFVNWTKRSEFQSQRKASKGA